MNIDIDSTDQYLKDNLKNIMNGEWDNQFSKDQLDMAKQTSFLLNHINIEENSIVFEYDNQKVKYTQDILNTIDYNLHGGDFKTHMLSMIRNDEPFKSAYKSFIRDWKIDSIIN
jgi:hypothetical protein